MQNNDLERVHLVSAHWGKSCSECIRYKATNQKHAGLLQTPVPAQRFESIAIDLSDPLPETTEAIKGIFRVEDYTIKWVELFALKQDTAKECAITLLNEVLLSKTSQNRSAKLMPRRDGPYIVLSQRSPTTFVAASCDKPDEPLGVYHTSALTPFLNGTETQSL
ncbi:transposon Tf2-11 polyprotein [Trichonephila clavipes]|nr:transposon Tf2-11 polyprotein [Trichonephila clavipes]